MPSRSSCLESENLSELHPAPRLLVELPSRRQVFFSNLFDLLLRRRPPVVEVSSSPSAFWPDVFVASGVRWSRFFESIAMHVLAIACVVSLFGLFQGIEQQRNPALEIHDKVVYYSASEFLPAIDTGSEPKPETVRPPRKADPLPAKQKIISLPPNHDNTEQTIIAAPEIKLKQHVNLPNIVAVNQAPLPVPTAVATREISRLQMPLSPNAIIAPPPDPVQRDLSRANMADFQAKVARRSRQWILRRCLHAESIWLLRLCSHHRRLIPQVQSASHRSGQSRDCSSSADHRSGKAESAAADNAQRRSGAATACDRECAPTSRRRRRAPARCAEWSACSCSSAAVHTTRNDFVGRGESDDRAQRESCGR